MDAGRRVALMARLHRAAGALPSDGGYAGLFVDARSSARHFILHVGPTNSGKTFDALSDLVLAGRGVYLAPLRLLALEVGDTLRENRIAASVVTGEESDRVPGETHVSSTVEMLDVTRPFDVAVIDEAQMLADPVRGSAWTRAILGVNADTVHVCMAPEALGIVERLIGQCPLDDYEVVWHERQTPLELDPDCYDPDEGPRPGDAIIRFTRKSVLVTASELERRGYRVSVVYGSLPWKARVNEARKFRDGETDVLVATDSIGMGLNLPIRRIVFLGDRKFDGSSNRFLTSGEYKQIAGRAGRRGMYDKGLVTGTDFPMLMRIMDALKADEPPIRHAYMRFPDQCALDSATTMTDMLDAWTVTAPTNDAYLHEDVYNKRQATDWLERNDATRGMPRSELLAMAGVPFTWDDASQRYEWQRMCIDHATHGDDMLTLPGGAEWRDRVMIPESAPIRGLSLRLLERRMRLLGVRNAFAYSIGLLDGPAEGAFASVRRALDRLIMARLDASVDIRGIDDGADVDGTTDDAPSRGMPKYPPNSIGARLEAQRADERRGHREWIYVERDDSREHLQSQWDYYRWVSAPTHYRYAAPDDTALPEVSPEAASRLKGVTVSTTGSPSRDYAGTHRVSDWRDAMRAAGIDVRDSADADTDMLAVGSTPGKSTNIVPKDRQTPIDGLLRWLVTGRDEPETITHVITGAALRHAKENGGQDTQATARDDAPHGTDDTEPAAGAHA